MTVRRPKGRTSIKHPSKPKKVVSPTNMPMTREYAQQARQATAKHTGISKVKRAQFWAHQSEMAAAEAAAQANQELAQISQGSLKSEQQLGTANIHAATLQSATPSVGGSLTVANVGESGIVPPPPPAP